MDILEETNKKLVLLICEANAPSITDGCIFFTSIFFLNNNIVSLRWFTIMQFMTKRIVLLLIANFNGMVVSLIVCSNPSRL